MKIIYGTSNKNKVTAMEKRLWQEENVKEQLQNLWEN